MGVYESSIHSHHTEAECTAQQHHGMTATKKPRAARGIPDSATQVARVLPSKSGVGYLHFTKAFSTEKKIFLKYEIVCYGIPKPQKDWLNILVFDLVERGVGLYD